jgi:PPOX class probable F420-dependent enzyme
MAVIDASTEFGARVLRHLEQDQVIWLTTVGPELTPQPSPVWFIWDGETVLMFSQPGTPKLRNIGLHPRVSLNFNSTEAGGDVVVLNANAAIDDNTGPADTHADYIAKYTGGLATIGMSPEAFALAYSVPVRIRPTNVRGL